jgi:hypothetical protein
MGSDAVQHWSSHEGFPPTLYMPCWDETELQLCRRVVAPTDAEAATDNLKGPRLLSALSAETVNERVRVFGGIARAAFARPSALPALKRKLESAINKCDLEVVGRQVGSDMDLLPEASSWLLHYVVDLASFDLINIKFASSHILQRVYEHAGVLQRDKVISFINATSQNPVWSGARGNIFELCLGHDVLQNGGTFPVQQFVDPLTTVRGKKGKRHSLSKPLRIARSA